MSRLIASTMTHRTMCLADALKKIASAGFDRVELCTVGDWVPHFDAENADRDSIERIAGLFEETGIALHAVNCGAFSRAGMKNVFSLARRCGAGIVTVPCGEIRDDVSRAEAIRSRAKLNGELLEEALDNGVQLAVEAPHKNTLASKSGEIDEYWEAQDERIRCTFDTAHLTFAGEDILPIARKYARRIAHVHLRDAVPGNSLMRYGEGVVDFAAFRTVLDREGYSGLFSMEYPADSDEEAAEKLVSSVKFLSQFGI